MKRKLSLFLSTLLAMTVVMTGCNSSTDEKNDKEKETKAKQEESVNLEGKSLKIYCGAGMTKPFQKIADEFKKETKCDVEVTYANAAQIQTQIKTSDEGDLFIAGSKGELNPIKDKVTKSSELVKHIPVLAVRKGNPKKITGLKDLANKDIEVVLGDYKATPIGKIAKKSLADTGIFKKVNVISNATTAPELTNSLAKEQCDATIVWKENTNNKKVEVVDTKDLDKYIKTVPAATLSSSENSESLQEFMKFLNSDKAKDIWVDFGYELVD